MRRRTLILYVCLLLSLLFVLRFSAATLTLRVNEKSTRFDMNGAQAMVTLAVENLSGNRLAAHIALELLDPENKQVAQSESREELRAGVNSVRVLLAFDAGKLQPSDRSEFLWYRLRYRVTPDAAESDKTKEAEGIISLSKITPELFELRISAARKARKGTPYRVRVQSTHPITRKPIGGVQLSGEIELDDTASNKILQAKAVTDAEGYATLDFKLPATIDDDEGDIRVKGRLNGLEREAEASFDFDRSARILLTTDKPLYQPGQTLHLRALVFDSTEHARADADTSFEIEDTDDTTVFRASVKTTRFGVASTDWQIPDNAPLGDYRIKVGVDGSDSDEYGALAFVKISRYDLPNFTVSAKADRAYYLPNRNAEVEVRADYLFGQPVTRGHVRVVRETERRWDFKEQKWETEEGAKIEGELDSAGRFVARINLQEEHKSFAEESYARFQDLSYAAYITDASTNRTEQRRFQLRLTKEPIHIYVVEGHYNQAEGLPLVFYVSTSYADGTPAQCELNMQLEEGDDDASDSQAASTIRTRRAEFLTVKTNRYGVARVVGPSVRRDESSREITIKIRARDSKGRAGHHDEDFWLENRSAIRVETDKAIYRPGEAVRATLTSNKEEALCFVDVASDLKVIRSEAVRLENGRGVVTFPYGKDFDGKLTLVAAFYERGEDGEDGGEVMGRRTILYPRDRELKLDVRVGQSVYRPGEEAQATLSASAPQGRPLESVFGVVVFDKAVEERSRTDAEFNSAYGFYDYFRYFWYGADEIAGITLRELERLDLRRKPVTEDLNLVADILLQNSSTDYERASFESDDYEENQATVFGHLIQAQLAPVKKALGERYLKTAEYPAKAESVRRFLRDAQIDLDQLRDPWGEPYHLVFSVKNESDVLEIMSAGADKQFGTSDDFSAEKFTWSYFRPLGEKIDRIINEYHARTGGFIRDVATLKAELARGGIGDEALRDRWGEPYRFGFGTSGTLLLVRIESGGTNKCFEPERSYNGDDFIIWTTWVDSFEDTRLSIDSALNSYLQSTGRFPQDEASFSEALKRAGIDRNALLDPSGRVYFAGFKSESRYVDRVVVEGRRAGAEAEKRTTVKPVSQRIFIITLFSAGADMKGGTADDFNAATFTSIAYEQAADEANAQAVQPQTTLRSGTGAVSGSVVDVNGNAVPGFSVTAKHKYTGATYETTTNDEGKFLLRNLPGGLYSVRVDAQKGFAAFELTDVLVRSSNLTQLNITLQAAGVTAVVNVTDTSGAQINTTSNTIGTSVTVVSGVKPSAQLSTPRLREYFPETLVWQPALETDKQGRASLSFKLADNITTWKMSVIGSTADGSIGTAEKEIRAFQPFFVEHDPPRILTEGDEIALPVVLRNYLERAQTVDLEIKPEKWFSLISPTQQRASVRAGDAAREVFNFRATSSVKDGKQRVTAIGEEASDAIERPVTVHPYGKERAVTDSRVFTDSATLEADIPAEVIKSSISGEIKIYPNLIAHVFESIEGILERPYGCGEQTISSTYTSLLVLRAYKRNQLEPPEKIGAKATRYLRDGYKRLLNYRAESGGFSYWGGRSEADLALTAYALRFLHDAREFIEVDDDVVAEARSWLISKQRTEGSWPAYLYSDREKESGSALVTALIARSLALDEKREAKAEAQQNAGAQKQRSAHDALKLALDYLARKSEEIDEPYLIASYALALLDAGENGRAARATERLRRLAHEEGDRVYWSLQTNTPFYGWGLAGRIETSALVVQALAREDKVEGAKSKEETDALINHGLLFLLRQKDRYGVWYSTQATINVLDALIALLSTAQSASDGLPSTANIIVNGKPAGAIQLPPANQLSAPLTLDVSKFLSAGENRVEIRRAGGAQTQASAQFVSNFYVEWSKALADETRANSASALKLTVNFDKTETAIASEVSCKVRAERLGFSGYGMMLAEIGLPPGADVDRSTLERAMKDSGWSFTRYDILPDRLVVYLWPQAGGTSFEFKFRPRFGLKAQTAPSVLYDYYNPEARTSLAPVRFVVR